MYTVKSSEDLQASLQQVLELLERGRVLEELARRQGGPQHQLLEDLTRRQNLAALHNRLKALHPADLGFILEALPPRERLTAWAQVPPRQAGEALVEVSEGVRASLLEGTPRPALLEILRNLDPDDLAYLAEAVPADVLEEATGPLSAQDRSWVRASFRPGSVGQLMTQEVVTTREERTCAEVLAELRSRGELPPQTDAVFVVDARNVLRGVLPLHSLLTAAPDRAMPNLWAPPAVAFTPDDPARQAAQAFERYDLVSAPVVDERGKLVGRLTVDAVMDFLRREAELKALQRAGLRGEEDLFAPSWDSARNRALWLGINLATAFVASRVIGLFEETIAGLVALATLMPIVASVGGNTGNQTVALVIRALALDQLSWGNMPHLFRKELAVAVINGLAWGAVMGLFAYLLYRSLPLGMVMAAAILLNLLVAAVVGLAVPLLLRRLGRDPAQGSSVLLTFTTDGMGFLIFLGLAHVFLR
jgi:magnesium transporter